MRDRSVPSVHPCLRCGACCATFRVSFYWRELVSGGGETPDELTRQVTPHRAAMLGTTAEPPRCVGLAGTVGESVACTLYDARPTPCREFTPSFEDGERNVRCDEARLRHGLRPLSPSDWRTPSVPRRPRRIAG